MSGQRANKEKISIIIPCYNVEDLIKRCLDSVWGQTAQSVSYEVICVDDKSTDKTLEILQDYEQRHAEDMIVISLPENRKQGYARNIALDYAGGEYIMYVDADDVIADGMLEALYLAVTGCRCDAAGCGYKSFTEKPDMEVVIDGQATVYDLGETEARQRFLMKHCLRAAPWGNLYRKEFLERENIFFPEGVMMEDTYFTELCMAHMRRYVYIPYTYYFYYLNPKGTFHNKQISYFMDALQVQNWATDRIAEEKLQAGCEQEWEYIHFYKAFRDPMIKMIRNRTFFSYENYLRLFSELHKRYPNVAENIYIAEATSDVAVFMRETARSLYTERELKLLMYGEKDYIG